MSTKVLIGPVRLSYPALFEPKTQSDGKDPKYQASLLIDHTTAAGKKILADCEKAVVAALELGNQGGFKGKTGTLKNVKLPIRDGDDERDQDPAYAGHKFLNTSSKTKPGIVDKDIKPIIDQSEIYPGCYVYASINFYPFNFEGKLGIAVGLNNIMKWEDGEALAGRASAEEDFASIASKVKSIL